MGEDFTPIGKVNYRNSNQVFGIKDADRLGHIYIIGKTGVGKTTLLQNMIISDIHRGNGLALIDPHGDISSDILNYVPEHRKKDVVYFNPKDTEYPISINPLIDVHPKYHHLVTSGIIGTFKKVWSSSWGPRMEYILRYSILTLLQYPAATLLFIQPLLTDDNFRANVLGYVTDKYILQFWRNEYERYNKALQAEIVSPVLNKIGVFTASAPLRNTIGRKAKGIKMQEIMDGRKIFIANLSKGDIGEDASTLLGSILVTSIQLAAMHRAKQKENTRVPFYLYIDEMHNFITLSFAQILSESRKFSLALCVAHQYIEQLEPEIRSAIFGNIGTLISFRVGSADAEYLQKEFKQVFAEEDLVNLPRFHIYLKLMIDGATSLPFSATTLAIHEVNYNLKNDVIKLSNKTNR